MKTARPIKKPMQEHILSVAAELFQSRGINATGVDAIVAESDIAKMTLYKYFRSKEELILAVLRKANEELQKWLSERLEKPGIQPAEKLLKFLDAMEAWINTPQFSGLPFQQASAEFPQAEHPVHQFSAEISGEFRAYISALVREYGVAKPEALAMQLSLLIEGAALTEQVTKGSGAASNAKKAAIILIEAATGKPLR